MSRIGARLERRRLFARLVLTFEQFWRLAWPPLGLIGLFVAAALFGVIALLQPVLHLAVLVMLLLAFMAEIVVAARHFRWPSRQDAERRLEQANGLAHRPLAALADRPATQNPTSLALWEVHRERMAAKVAGIRVGAAHPNLAAIDGWALRAGLLVLLIAGIGVAGPEAPGRLDAAFMPR
ncbi:MAG: DUF4175 family protein, partial [Acetobacteraceae bacterium]